MYWIKLLKDYDYNILYHPDKSNMVADALSRKSAGMLVHLMVSECRAIGAAQNIRLQDLKKVTYLADLTVKPQLIQRIKEVQSTDSTIAALKKDAEQGVTPEF